MAAPRSTVAYTWQIKDFRQQISILENGGSITSAVFSLLGNSNAKFSTKIEHNGTDSCAVYLICNDFGRKRKLQLDIKISEDDGNAIESKLTFKKDLDTCLLLGSYAPSDMNENAINDVWTFRCKIGYDDLISEFDEDPQEELVAHCEFSRKQFEIHSRGNLDSTVTIQAGNSEFKISKLALMACSYVFYRMFLCESSTEAKTGIFKIDDIKPEVIDASIRWIHQIEVNNFEEIATDLYCAADKYDIGQLKDKCIKVMARGLSKENLAPRLMFAHKYSEDRFKKHILNFLDKDNENWRRLMASDEWMELCSEDPEAAKSILAKTPH
jgi:hypothetical protein